MGGPGLRQGVVSVAKPHGAEVGASILEQGGNANDAAVAIADALNVVDSQSGGIGGGGFMPVHLANTGETLRIDTRETASAGASRDMFVGVSQASRKGVAVGVPGMVRGTARVLAEQGRLTLAQVLPPAIRLAGGLRRHAARVAGELQRPGAEHVRDARLRQPRRRRAGAGHAGAQ